MVESTEKGERGEIPCRGLFIAMGFSPDTGILEESGIALDADGYIKLKDPARTLTETPGVFAAEYLRTNPL